MKKVLMGYLIFCASFTGVAQIVGIKAGVHATQLRLQQIEHATYLIEFPEFRFIPGFNVAGTFDYAFSDHVSFSAALGVIHRRCIFQYEAPYHTIDYSSGSYEKTGINYWREVYKSNLLMIDVPLQVKGTMQAGDVDLFAGIGFYVSAPVKSWEKENQRIITHPFGAASGYETTLDTNTVHNFVVSKTVDYGPTASLGAVYEKFSFEAAYRYGLSTIVIEDQPPYYRALFKSHSLQFSIGYRFN